MNRNIQENPSKNLVKDKKIKGIDNKYSQILSLQKIEREFERYIFEINKTLENTYEIEVTRSSE